MEKKSLLLVVTGVVLLVLSGCGGTVSLMGSASPGNVLDNPEGMNTQRVVTFEVVGKGLEPENSLTRGQAVIMAERAAVADGYRQLVEKIRGVYVDAQMKAGNGTVNYDAISVRTQSWLRGTEVMEITQGEYGITNARLRLRINFSKEGMVWWPVGIGENVKPVAASTSNVTGG